MEGTIGEIRMFAGNFAPRNWAFCSGQLLAIASNTALFSIIGCTYGGDCKTTFALPDLRGRRAMHSGQGPGLRDYNIGQMGGAETHTLTMAEMPVHNHAVVAQMVVNAPLLSYNDEATDMEPANAFYAFNPNEERFFNGTPNAVMGPASSNFQATVTYNNTGGGQPFDILSAYQSVYYVICTAGIFPSRN